ncbi:hypothetical protein LTS18_008817, partial [Coniosporium uncinatum]
LVRRIEVEPKTVSWSESGELVALCCEETFYVLRFSREAYVAALQNGEVDDDGVEAAFEVVCDISESATSSQWVGDCLIFTNTAMRLNYLVGDKVETISHFDVPHYILGYLPRDSRIYLADKDISISSFALSLSVLEYQTLVLRGELDAAEEVLEQIPQDQKNKIARFLEGQGYKQQALEIATDPEQRFQLSLDLGRLDIALELAKEADQEVKWKTVGDAALTAFDIKLAAEAFEHAKDLGSLLLLRTAAGDADGLRQLASQAQDAMQSNVAFACLWQLGDKAACIELLESTGRSAEAVLFSQTYCPSLTPAAAKKWKDTLEKDGKTKLARRIAVPPNDEGDGDDDMFPEWNEWISLEKEGGTVSERLVDVGGEEEEPAEEQEEAVEAYAEDGDAAEGEETEAAEEEA